MPIEIKELIVRAVVETGEDKQHEDSSSASGTCAEISEEKMEMMIEMCIEQVMEILREKEER